MACDWNCATFSIESYIDSKFKLLPVLQENQAYVASSMGINPKC